jgi:hypothetical protein
MLSKNHLKASAGIAMAVAAVGAPAASAMPIRGQFIRQDKQVANSAPTGRALAPSAFLRQDKQVLVRRRARDWEGRSSAPVASSPRSASPYASPGGGFDWGDAGIGAAGGLVLSIAGLGIVLVITRRRPTAARTSAPVTS